MQIKLKRNRALAFQDFGASLQRAAAKLPDLESAVVPHYSEIYTAVDFQDLANQLEFKSEAEGCDEVVDAGTSEVLATIEEEFARPVLVVGEQTFAGPVVQSMGNPDEMMSEEYAKKMVHDIFRRTD